MTNRFKINYSNVETMSDKVIFSKEVKYNNELLELIIRVEPKKNKRINYEYRPIAQEI